MLRSTRPRKMLLQVPALFAALLLVAACSINVRKNENGEEKKVDIETPVGSIHVDKGADAVDTGLAVYPGAKVVEKEKEGDDKNANVNLSAFGFGLHVAAVQYQSDDPPAKILDFYRGQLKKYGNVLECHNSGHSHASYGRHDSDSKGPTCEDDSGNGTAIELKAGNRDSQHIVSVEPSNKGCKFALVYIQTRGKDTI
jgi:hypothetical protein